MHNPFLEPLQQLLLQNPQRQWTEHELLLGMVQQGLLDPAYGRDSMALFHAHFLTMNALYQLRTMLWNEQQWSLLITPLEIRLQSTGSGEGILAGDTADERLAQYYLDWSNFQRADRRSIGEMLQEFWRRFVRPPGRESALQVLGLQDPVSDGEIRQRYRQRVMECHPDRGGSVDDMVALNRAMETLRHPRN
ncbi:DNA-J related domain-containing protein [Pseudomaricurvus sp. HS19]|uniref:DNA-J related domain-containing protein n=1 Tax=Pseudomaricurvus sp. HS19 TaxID=2692626 RepID=UPI00136840AF|nr:DNA-J related domain-containing protein [Pseudomaricurvus sp. HS19]MYM62303.1 DnaJ domain-containing protein [Pseudomaricurvus sp. HS19]